MNREKLKNVWWDESEDGGADLYVNDKSVGHIEDAEDARRLENNVDEFLTQEFKAGFDKGLLAGGITMILGGVAMIATKLVTGVRKRVGKY